MTLLSPIHSVLYVVEKLLKPRVVVKTSLLSYTPVSLN